jgi:5-methylcytosine-specific restriction endonuclease McrBC regulatory subunit McrC
MLIHLVDNRQNQEPSYKGSCNNLQELLKGVSGKKYSELCAPESGFIVFPPNALAVDIKNDDVVLESRCDNDIFKFTTGNVMGFFSLGEDVRVKISSRFDNAGKDYFLHYMLQKVCNVAYTPRTESGEDAFYDFLYQLFPYYLNEALAQGVFRAYVTREYNNANVRGPIDVARHIKFNIPFNGKIAYHTREYTTDNAITQLIRHTIEYIRSLQYGKTVLENSENKSLRDNVMAIEMATPTYSRNDRLNIIHRNARPVTHPYYTAYEPLRKLCLAILTNQKLSYGEDSENMIAGILFDGASLWEEYLNIVLAEAFKSRLMHPNNRIGFGRQYLFNGTSGDIFPDFLLDIDPEFDDVMTAGQVLDAKYRNNALDSDVYKQMLSYMFRFDSKIGQLIYPVSPNNSDKGVTVLKLRRDNSIVLRVIPFIIPAYEKNLSFKLFADAMKEAEKVFLDKISKDVLV